MISSRRPGTLATLFVALFLLVEGAWGLIHPPAYGLLPSNTTRAAIHIVFGILGILILRTGQVRGYLKIVGSIVTLVGVGYFLPIVGDMIRNLLAVDKNGALINIAVGLTALLASRSEKHTGPREPRDRSIPT